ncbi:MAG TPA: phosphate ABC transporter, permease protein PstA, partial [Planctomycetota bacterium]|nr:phosphate ABC transporter, permease protein PstA [Planctomycetota bacterium]
MKRFWKDGDPWIWLTGGALAACLILVSGLVFLITVSGMGFFWPQEVQRLRLANGTSVLGSAAQTEVIPHAASLPDGRAAMRVQMKQGNRDLYGTDFVWIDESKIV